MKPPRSRRLLRMRRRAVALGVVLSSLYGMAIAPSSGFLGRSVFNGMDASKTRLTHLRPPAWRHTPEPADVFRTEHIRGVATHWRRPRSKTGRIFVMDPNREEEYEDERMKNLSTLSDEQIKEMNLNSLSVGDIRNELQARGWTTNGNKSELIDRLVHAVNAGESKEGMERDASVEEYLRSRLESCTVIELKDGLKARGLAGYGSRQEIQQRIMDELSDETILDLLEEIDGMEEEEEENEIANNADTVRPVDQVDEVWTLNQESDQCDQQDEQPENMGELTNYPGVTWKGKTGKWEAVTMNENKQQFVGLFKSEEDAWAAITKRREKLGWPQIVLESGYKYAVFPGTNLHPEKHLWTASTSHWGITENLGEFASRSEAWFEIQRVRREKGWPELRPFEPVSQNMEKEKKPTQPETAEISPQAETESASIPDVSAPEPASDISNASAPDSTLDIADSAASTESQSEITAVSAFGGDDDDDYDETIQNSNLLVLSVSELKAEAKKRDLSGRGRKIDIVARLERSMAEPDSEFDKPAEALGDGSKTVDELQAELMNFLEREKKWRSVVEKLTIEKRRSERILNKLESATWADPSLRSHLENAGKLLEQDLSIESTEVSKPVESNEGIENFPAVIQSRNPGKSTEEIDLADLRLKVDELSKRNDVLSLELAEERRGSKNLKKTVDELSQHRPMNFAFMEMEKKLKGMLAREVERDRNVRELEEERDSLTKQLVEEKRLRIEQDGLYEMSKPEILLNETFALLDDEKETTRTLQKEIERLERLTNTELVDGRMKELENEKATIEKELDFLRSTIASTGNLIERAVSSRISRNQQPIIRLQRNALKGLSIELEQIKASVQERIAFESDLPFSNDHPHRYDDLNALERLQKLTAILEETINMKVSFDDFPNISEEELREYSKSNDTYMSRLAELVIEDETKVASAQSEKLVKSGKGLHPLEDALDLSSQDLQTLRSIAKKKIKAEEKKRKDELLKQEESQRKFDLETPPPDDEVAFDWDRFNADVARLRAQNRSLQELDPEYVKAQKKIESNQNMMSEVLGSKKLFGDEQDIAELVKIMDLANMASQAEEKKSTDKDDPESNPIDGPVNEAWDQARVEAGEEPPLPKLKPSDRKLADRLITLFLTRDQREWPELIKDSDIWKASADNVFVRLQQKIRAVEDLQDEWILRVCERDLKNVHAMFLKGEGPFAPTTFSPAVLKRMASDWAASGPESMEKNDLELCDRLAGFFEARDPSEWFRILRESKSWPAIAERFFYRLRSRIRAERGEKRRKQLIEMRQILRECHQQVFGVEAPDTASLETFGADYRNFDKGQEDVDSNTRYYWNKVIGGSKRERRGDDGSK
mmetsp:Transcript_10633/g.26027  ORF Transcript_10633/g.26027 Transcript_10633/m.26027 type:complete len:1355 (+) Transcript_10633:43-4107(+)